MKFLGNSAWNHIFLERLQLLFRLFAYLMQLVRRPIRNHRGYFSVSLSHCQTTPCQLCSTICNPMVCPGILQARILEWLAISFSRGSSQPRDWTWVSIADRFFTIWATWSSHVTNTSSQLMCTDWLTEVHHYSTFCLESNANVFL